MQLTELLTRRLLLEKGDKVGKVLVTNSINDIVRSIDNVTVSCTELEMYDGAIVDTLVLCKGLNLKAKIGYRCVANTIHIGALASVYIVGTPEIHSIHIQENGCLHVGLAYLSKTKDIVLNFEMYSRYMKEIHIRTVPKIKNPTSGGFGITKTHKEKCHAN